jgi:hypothetical protein
MACGMVLCVDIYPVGNSQSLKRFNTIGFGGSHQIDRFIDVSELYGRSAAKCAKTCPCKPSLNGGSQAFDNSDIIEWNYMYGVRFSRTDIKGKNEYNYNH